MGSEFALGLSVVGCCRDDSTISQYVHVPAISRAPFQLHLMFGSLRLHARLEHNGVRATLEGEVSVKDTILRARRVGAKYAAVLLVYGGPGDSIR